MSLEPGDKVSFINEKQDGIIISIKANGICVVEIEDGFTLEALASELVKIKSLQKSPTISEKKEEIKDEDFLPDFFQHIPLDGTVSLIAVPLGEKIITGTIAYWLVNGTDKEVLFTFSSVKEKMQNGKAAGILSSKSSVELIIFKRDDMMEMEKFYVELLFHQKENHPSFPSLKKEIEIQLPSLNQHFPKAPSPLSFSVVHPLINFNQEPEADFKELMDKFKSDSDAVFVKQSKPSAIIINKKPDTSFREAGLSPTGHEVDLHIEELIDVSDGMSASEMILIQLARFRKELDNAIYRKASKIVFIHGIGNGRLKSTIRSELRMMKLEFRDGSYEKYGAGATEVILK